jgi:hypothetical protein
VLAAGINLSWDDCGSHGASNKTFACNSNVGSDVLVASFIPPDSISQFVGLYAELEVQVADATLPNWWSHGTGLCRGTTGLSVSFDFTAGPFSCTDAFTGQAVGGFAYDIGYLLPNQARLRVQCAVPYDAPIALTSTAEYYAFKTNLLHGKTTGASSCSGCANPSALTLLSIQLFQHELLRNDPTLVLPLSGTTVTWQVQAVMTPNEAASWGTLKALYK